MSSKSLPTIILTFVFAGAAGAAACGGASGPSIVEKPECNPLGGASCVTPWPSGIYEVDDSASATHVRIDIPAGALPSNTDPSPVDPTWLNKRNGWSANAPLIVAFSTGVDPTKLPPNTDLGKSVAADCPTVIVDMDATPPTPILHFAEVDSGAADQPAHQALIIRPAVRLQPGHHYAVGIRKSLTAPGGASLPISDGFQSLLDDKPTKTALLERARPRYPAIFAALAAAGVAKTDLVLAWDFHTATDDLATDDLLNARDAILAAAGPKAMNLSYTVKTTTPGGDPAVTLRTIEGTFDMPQVLTGDGGESAVLARDAAGKPMVVGTIQAPFGAVIPACASDPANLPMPVIVYGHGLMGSYDEALGGYPRWLAQHMCVIIIGTNWRGMSQDDLSSVAFALNDANKMPLIMDKLVQGVNQFVALEQMVQGPFATAPEFSEGGQPLIDPSRIYYYGISQGGIFGGTFMSIDPYITRGVLGVPAANYTYFLERSTDWPLYSQFIHNSYTDPLDDQILLTLFQTGWDRTDPVSFVGHALGVNADMPPFHDTPAKQILIQMAVHDCQVSNVGTYYEARLMGMPLLTPALFDVYGVAKMPGPLPSALTMWDEHLQPTPPDDANAPAPSDNGTHGSLRKRALANEQIKTFLETGDIVQTCTAGGMPAACDCTSDSVCGAKVQ